MKIMQLADFKRPRRIVKASRLKAGVDVPDVGLRALPGWLAVTPVLVWIPSGKVIGFKAGAYNLTHVPTGLVIMGEKATQRECNALALAIAEKWGKGPPPFEGTPLVTSQAAWKRLKRHPDYRRMAEAVKHAEG